MSLLVGIGKEILVGPFVVIGSVQLASTKTLALFGFIVATCTVAPVEVVVVMGMSGRVTSALAAEISKYVSALLTGIFNSDKDLKLVIRMYIK